jgi:hypothetical protein
MSILEVELNGFRRTLKKIQEEGENLAAILNRIDGEQEYTKRSIGNVTEQREKIAETYAVYMKSLSQTEKELSIYQQVLL